MIFTYLLQDVLALCVGQILYRGVQTLNAYIVDRPLSAPNKFRSNIRLVYLYRAYANESQ